jgi:hypothetical protein
MNIKTNEVCKGVKIAFEKYVLSTRGFLCSNSEMGFKVAGSAPP